MHGFTTEEINVYFASMQSHNTIESANINGFSFRPVKVNDVILAVSHFKSQAKGADGIPQSVIAEALPSIAPQLVCVFNESIAQGIFPTSLEEDANNCT